MDFRIRDRSILTVHPLSTTSTSIVIGIIYMAVIRRIHSDRYAPKHGRPYSGYRSLCRAQSNSLINSIRGPASPNKTYQCHVSRLCIALMYHAYHRDYIARLISAWRRNRFIRHHTEIAAFLLNREESSRSETETFIIQDCCGLRILKSGRCLEASNKFDENFSYVKTKIVCNNVFYIIFMNFLIKYGIRRFFDPSFLPISQYH